MDDDRKQFEVGDAVQLMSGGCWMTVRNVYGTEICCSWHDDEWRPREAVYTEAMLDWAKPE